MEPRRNRTFNVSVRRFIWTSAEGIVAASFAVVTLLGVRGLMRLLFGRPLLTPITCIVVASLVAAVVLLVLLSWRLAEHDRNDYMRISFRRIFSRHHAYNSLSRHKNYRPLVGE